MKIPWGNHLTLEQRSEVYITRKDNQTIDDNFEIHRKEFITL